MATTWAFHSGSSDDFNPSLAVGITSQKETVYLNWAFAAQQYFASDGSWKTRITPIGTCTSIVALP